MENFVSVILKTKELDENAIVEAMLDSLDAPLAERVTDYGLFESDNDTVVLRMPTPYALEESECEAFTQSFADKMFEMGYDDFDVEISLDEENVPPRPKGVAGMGWELKYGRTHNHDGTPKKASQPSPQAQTTAPKMGKSDTTSGKPPKVAGVQSNGKLTNFNIDKSLPSVDVKNIRTGETFRVYGPPANVEKLISRPEIEKVYGGRGDAGARQELELRKQQMKTGPDGAYDGDDLGNAPTAPNIKVTPNNYQDMIKRAKELAAKAKQAPSSGPSTRGKAGAKANPKANSAINTQADTPTTMMASMYDSIMHEMANDLYEELTDAEKKEYEAIVKGLEDLLASPDIDPPTRSQIDTALNDLQPDRADPRQGDASKDADQTVAGDTADDPLEPFGGKGEEIPTKPVGPKLDKKSALQVFAKSGKGGLANDPDEVEAIKELQESLKVMGFEIQVDGKYGPGTIEAVKQFQTMMGAKVDGDAGPETIAALTKAKSIPNIRTFYQDLVKMNQLISKANEGIYYETKLWEALTDAEQKELDELYNKHKAKFDDAEYIAALPAPFREKMTAISKHKAGAGATSTAEKEDAKAQVEKQEEQQKIVDEVQKIIADAKEKYGSSKTQLNKYLIMIAAKYIRKKEYALAIEIIQTANLNVGEDVYLALLRKSAMKGLDAPASSSSDDGADQSDSKDDSKGDDAEKAQGKPSNKLDGKDGTTSGDQETETSIEAKADVLADAIKGMGTDEDAIKKTLESLKNKEEWNQLQQAYKDKHGDLLPDMRDDLNEKDFKFYVADVLKKIDVTVEYEPAEDEELPSTTSDQEKDKAASYTGNTKEDIQAYLSSSLSKAETQEFVDAQSLDGKSVEELAELETQIKRVLNIVQGDTNNSFQGNEITASKDAEPIVRKLLDDIRNKMSNTDTPTSTDDNTSDTDTDTNTNTNTDTDTDTDTSAEVNLTDISAQLDDAMTGMGTDEEAIQEALEQLTSEDDWKKLQDTYKESTGEDLLDDLRGELNRKDFKTYVADVLKDKIDVEVKYRGSRNESVAESRVGFFEETYEGDEFYEVYGEIGLPDDEVWEAEYRGRKVKLNKPMRGDVKKFKVYVKNNKGNVIKVNFGDPDMKIKKSNPARRRSFRARHNCDNPGPKTKARYWSCRKW